MEVFNPFDFMFKLWDILFKVVDVTWSFLFNPVSLGFDGMKILGVTMFQFGFSFVPFYGIASVLGVLMVMALVKDFVPFL